MDRTSFEQMVKELYGIVPDYPWRGPEESAAVFRHKENRKWFALLMDLPRNRIGLDGDAPVSIVNLKCDPVLIGSLRTERGFYPAYHMNKERWISILLDDGIAPNRLLWLLQMSYTLTASKAPNKTRTIPK